jgi:ribulose-5-phosphate 4-epimerase/fuculose-1-phosphate aldolase
VAGIISSPAGSAILVPQNSSIQKLTDLKGKKVAFQKGSSAHLLLVQALEKAGLKYTDIEPKYLPPADARAAFVKGSVDAWVIWNPFYTAAQEVTKARVLIDGTGINKQGGYYLATRKFVQALGPNKAIILRNHSILTVGHTVDEAAFWYISLERSCQAQLLAEAAGRPTIIKHETARLTQTQVGSHISGWFSFQPLYDRIIREEPDLLD